MSMLSTEQNIPFGTSPTDADPAAVHEIFTSNTFAIHVKINLQKISSVKRADDIALRKHNPLHILSLKPIVLH